MHTPPAPIPQSKFLLLSIEIYFYLLKEKKKKNLTQALKCKALAE